MTAAIDLSLALKTAEVAARAAGKIILDADRGALTIRTKSSPRDYVTQIDEAAQAEIVRIIHATFPDHPILGEEGDVPGKADCPYLWIVDPLDGTTNFLHGKPACGTIIALRNGRQTILGLLYLPHSGELFTATWGQGAFWNGTPVRLRETAGMDDAVICSNIFRRMQQHYESAGFPECASVENYGCAIEAFAAVLRGQNDGVLYEGPHLWDTAAGCLLIEEAGGKARLELIDPANLRGKTRCVASTKPIFDELCAFGFPR